MKKTKFGYRSRSRISEGTLVCRMPDRFSALYVQDGYTHASLQTLHPHLNRYFDLDLSTGNERKSGCINFMGKYQRVNRPATPKNYESKRNPPEFGHQTFGNFLGIERSWFVQLRLCCGSRVEREPSICDVAGYKSRTSRAPAQVYG